ncbi:MAG: DUF2783 domain-containing protein [Burkholderiaceae bacterium]
MTLGFEALEPVYESLAVRLDALPAAQRELYLVKLVLMLAHRSDDDRAVLDAIEACAVDLDPAVPTDPR